MIGGLKKIVVYDERRRARALEKIQLEEGKGIPGDRHYNSDGDPISLWLCPEEVFLMEEWPPENHRKGLCTLKFKANLIAQREESSHNEDSLIKGDTIHIGEAVLKINEKKPCYDDCPLVESGDTCALKDNVYFTSVAKAGMIGVGDGIKK